MIQKNLLLLAADALAIIVVAVAVTAAPATARQSLPLYDPVPLMQNAPTTTADRSFVATLLQMAREQIAIAQLARERATSASTLRCAAGISDEWIGFRTHLIAIAIAEGAPVRGTLSAAQVARLRQLGRTQPDRFARTFMKDAERANDVAFRLIRQEGNTANRDIRDFIDEAAPIVTEQQMLLVTSLAGWPTSADARASSA